MAEIFTPSTSCSPPMPRHDGEADRENTPEPGPKASTLAFLRSYARGCHILSGLPDDLAVMALN